MASHPNPLRIKSKLGTVDPAAAPLKKLFPILPVLYLVNAFPSLRTHQDMHEFECPELYKHGERYMRVYSRVSKLGTHVRK